MKKNIYLRIIKRAEKYPEGFNYNKIKKDFKYQNEREKQIIRNQLSYAYNNKKYIWTSGKTPNPETVFFIIDRRLSDTNNFEDDKCSFIINLEATFKYIDYLELVETKKIAKQASENAIQASKYARIAIRVAVWSFIASILFSILSICLSKKQIDTPIKINQIQLENLIKNLK